MENKEMSKLTIQSNREFTGRGLVGRDVVVSIDGKRIKHLKRLDLQIDNKSLNEASITFVPEEIEVDADVLIALKAKIATTEEENCPLDVIREGVEDLPAVLPDTNDNLPSISDEQRHFLVHRLATVLQEPIKDNLTASDVFVNQLLKIRLLMEEASRLGFFGIEVKEKLTYNDDDRFDENSEPTHYSINFSFDTKTFSPRKDKDK